MSQKPMTVLVDIGNVILSASQNTTIDFLEGLGVSRDKATLMYSGPEYLQFSVGAIDAAAFTKQLCEQYFGQSLSEKQVRQALKIHIHTVNRPLVAALQRLGRDRVVIVTDTNPWQTERERELVDPQTYAAWEFRSHDLGKLKSDPRFFREVLETLGKTASECLLIDDSLEKLRAAASLGIETYHFVDTEAAVARISQI